MVAQDPKEIEGLFDSTVQKNRPPVEQFFLDEVTDKGNFFPLIVLTALIWFSS